MEHTPEEIEAAIRILREDAILDHNAKVMERLDRMEARLNKSDEQELSDEEIVKLYKEGKLSKAQEEKLEQEKEETEETEWDEETAEKHRKLLGEYDAKRRPPAPPVKEPKADKPPKRGYWDNYQSSPKEEAV